MQWDLPCSSFFGLSGTFTSVEKPTTSQSDPPITIDPFHAAWLFGWLKKPFNILCLNRINMLSLLYTVTIPSLCPLHDLGDVANGITSRLNELQHHDRGSKCITTDIVNCFIVQQRSFFFCRFWGNLRTVKNELGMACYHVGQSLNVFLPRCCP